jgi:hypothetical protein
MASIEIRGMDPDEMIREIEASVRLHRENKYAFQNGLKDLDFEVDQDLLIGLDLNTPFQTIGQAERALTSKAIVPKTFIEYDGTEHQVAAFDARPVGYSGFMECCTHSLTLTDLGLFEVGRYPAVSLDKPGKHWQWFLHRQLATPESLHEWQEKNRFTGEQLLDRVYTAMTGIGD